MQQHLVRVKQRMKNQADKHRTERQFVVGDVVFLKLHPYAQSSVLRHSSEKLAFPIFGPHLVLQLIGSVAYRFQLLDSSGIHLVFHVSQLKRYLALSTQVQQQLPASDSRLQVPMAILQRRTVERGKAGISQVLVEWSDADPLMSTWEDEEALQEKFRPSAAWGQSRIKRGKDCQQHLAWE
jgi:hypothetical protein